MKRLVYYRTLLELVSISVSEKVIKRKYIFWDFDKFLY